MPLTVDFDPSSLTQGVLVSKHSTGTSGFYMFSITPSNGNLSFTVINSTPTRMNVNMALQAGVDDSPGYHQAAGTYDGTTIRLFYDGVLLATGNQSGNINLMTAPLLLGDFNQPDVAGWEYEGLIDNVGLFSNALTDGGVSLNQAATAGSQIHQLYTQGLASFLVPAAVPGDYNGSTVVDAGDYVVWRKGGVLQNDPTPAVDPDDYTFSRSRFGASTPGGGSVINGGESVPEPATLLLLMFAATVPCILRRRAA